MKYAILSLCPAMSLAACIVANAIEPDWTRSLFAIGLVLSWGAFAFLALATKKEPA